METNPDFQQSANTLFPVADTTETDSKSGISETELTAFAGGNHYPKLLMRLLEGKSRHAGFNVWAMIFGIQWFFFRKLYLFGLFSVALESIAPLLFIALTAMAFGYLDRGAIIIITIVALIITRVIIGYMANIALCLKASHVIGKIDKLNKDNETHLRLIKRAGGVSVPSLLFVYLVVRLAFR
ncbi:MAG: DUF2628 domain-containing protein [Burkholderiales bacterium]|nr:DUF2628 domain-containing protein [Burkholderiales bacterium]